MGKKLSQLLVQEMEIELSIRQIMKHSKQSLRKNSTEIFLDLKILSQIMFHLV